MLRGSGIPWTVVRATAFVETWAEIMSRPLQASGEILVFGRGDNPINFVSASDVAALAERAVTDPGLRGQVLELGGRGNLTFNQLAAMLQEVAGGRGVVRHIPRPALRTMACLTAAIKPALARQARAALVMDTLDMTFDASVTRRAFPDLPETDMPSALKELLSSGRHDPDRPGGRGGRNRLPRSLRLSAAAARPPSMRSGCGCCAYSPTRRARGR